jgi:hypothetical protein
MKYIISLTLVALTLVQALAQTEAELTPLGKFGRKILMENGIKTECFGVTETPQGLIISSRTGANIPVNFLYTVDKQLKKIDQLDRYIVFDYSPVKGDLLLGKYEIDPNYESMCRELDTYNMTTKKFTFQCKLGWVYGDKTKYTTNFDSLTFLTMQKSSDGIGSDWVTKKVKLK